MTKVLVLKRFGGLKEGTKTDQIPEGSIPLLIKRGIVREIKRGRPRKEHQHAFAAAKAKPTHPDPCGSEDSPAGDAH